MTKRILLALCCTALLSVPAFAGDEAKTPACCAKKVAAGQTVQKLRCSLTGKEVDKCCCVEREGKLHCPLAKKDVEKCCCTKVKAEGKQAKQVPATR